MRDALYARFSALDVELVIEALTHYQLVAPTRGVELERLAKLLETLSAPPEITIGVFGGIVQWTQGNPFPIRIVDYDGEESELPNRDRDGHPCAILERAS